MKLIYLILLLTLNVSCVEKKSTEKETTKPEVVVTSKTDTLKFTSGIRAIFQDSKGNYWLGSHNEGVTFYNGKSFEYFTTNEGLANNQILSIQEDTKGKIWIGTSNGVSVYDKGTLTNYITNTKEPKYEWNKTTGDLWFYATVEDGINRFDGQHMNYLVFPKPKKQIPGNTYGVTGISKDKEGKVWIATYAALFSYDGKVVDMFDDEKLSLKSNELLHIRSVLADSKGRVWVGNIWFGDRDTGAWKYDGKTLTNYKIDSKLNAQMIWSIYKDNKNNLLFGMAEGGVYKLNGKTFDKQF